MSGVALDVAVSPMRQRSFGRLLLAVFLGYVGAVITWSFAALALLRLDVMPRPFVRPGPFPIDGAWSLAADIVVAALFVLVTAWWIRRMVESAVRGHVSLAVVALAVVVTWYVPVLVLPFVAGVLWWIVALVATTWIVRRYALGLTRPLPKLSGRVCAALGLIGFFLLVSYRVYHPFTGTGQYTDVFGPRTEITLKNSDWSDVTIVRVDGGWVGTASGLLHPHKLPYTLRSRSEIGLYASVRPCVRHDVNITYAVLGRTSSQRFTFTPDAPGNVSGTDLPQGAGCDEYTSAR